MKKIILSLILVFAMMFSTTFAYDMSIKDKKLIDKINIKIDLIYKKSPNKIEKLYKKIQKILAGKLKGKEDTRIYVLINEINIHLEEILNKEEDRDDGDLNDLLFGEEKIEKKVIKSTDNKQEIIKRLNKGEKCFQLTEGKTNEIKDFCFKEELKIYIKKGGKCSELKTDILSKKKCLELEKIKDNNFIEKKEILKNEYYTDNKGRRFKIYDLRDTSYLNEGFSCIKKRYCKEMDSCKEATYYYKKCGAKGFDRDRDLIPCENICGERIKKYEY